MADVPQVLLDLVRKWQANEPQDAGSASYEYDLRVWLHHGPALVARLVSALEAQGEDLRMDELRRIGVVPCLGRDEPGGPDA